MDNYEILNAARRMIFDQRDRLYNIILTIAGGALILSLTFIERFGLKSQYLELLKFSWVFLTLSIFSNILMRYLYNVASLIDSDKEHFKLANPNKPIEEFFKDFKPELKYTVSARIFFWLFWLSFFAGLIMLLIFAILSS